MKVSSSFIGDDEPTFVVAETGANHNKNSKTAKRLIDATADANAAAVKFQIFSDDLRNH